jgi:hypothetical protein
MRGARSKIVLLDACRDNPLATRMVRFERPDRGIRIVGLAQIDQVPQGTVIAFAAAPGRTAADGDGANSPFTTALLANLTKPGEDLRLVLGDVAEAVQRATSGGQQPWVNFTGMSGRLFLRPLAPPPTPVVMPAPAPVQPSPMQLVPPPVAASVTQPVPAQECDRLAQPPRTAMGRFPSFAEGVEFDRMNGSAALQACQQAVQAFPAEPRFRMQLGRALDRLSRFGEAMAAYRTAADQGYLPALSNLGLMHANGQGVARNDAEAVRLYRLAADQGFAAAQHGLGFMHENGQGVAKNEAEAVRLYRLAADQGYALAQAGLGFLYANGRGVPASRTESIRWYRLAARQGNVPSQNYLRAIGEREPW